MPAFRAARLLSEADTDRTGSGKFVEVYPCAARHCFGLGRTRSVDELRERASWLHLDPHACKACAQSEDGFDALIATLVARASAQGLCEPIPDEDEEAAQREGWIALPLPGSLERLPTYQGAHPKHCRERPSHRQCRTDGAATPHG